MLADATCRLAAMRSLPRGRRSIAQSCRRWRASVCSRGNTGRQAAAVRAWRASDQRPRNEPDCYSADRVRLAAPLRAFQQCEVPKKIKVGRPWAIVASARSLPLIGKVGLESSVNDRFCASIRSLAALAVPTVAKTGAISTVAPISTEHTFCLMIVSTINFRFPVMNVFES